MIKEKETYWSQFADDFEEKNNYVVGIENLEMVYDRLKNLDRLDKTLELGCGNGTYSKQIYPYTSSLTSTDYSDEMVQVAGARLNHMNIQVQKEDCFNLSFKDKSFDTVFMANLIHIIPEPEKALRECHRVLKEDGQLLIVSYTTDTLSQEDFLALRERYAKAYGPPSPTAYKLTENLLNDMLSKEGFTQNNSQLVGKTMKAIISLSKKSSSIK